MTGSRALFILVLCELALVTGCAYRTQRPQSPSSSPDLSFCHSIFPAKDWESVHKIQAAVQGRAIATLLGVTRGSPTNGGLHTFLLTPEGFVLFEADTQDGKITTRKATAPFDSPEFTGGLMEDVRLLFFSPPGELVSGSKGDDGASACLWESPDQSQTEIRGSMDFGWRMVRRDKDGEMTREVLLKGPFVNGLAAHIELRALKPAPYNLRLTLVQAGH